MYLCRLSACFSESGRCRELVEGIPGVQSLQSGSSLPSYSSNNQNRQAALVQRFRPGTVYHIHVWGIRHINYQNRRVHYTKRGT